MLIIFSEVLTGLGARGATLRGRPYGPMTVVLSMGPVAGAKSCGGQVRGATISAQAVSLFRPHRPEGLSQFVLMHVPV